MGTHVGYVLKLFLPINDRNYKPINEKFNRVNILNKIIMCQLLSFILLESVNRENDHIELLLVNPF